MSISGITSQISNLQAIRAQNAFQKAMKPKEEVQEPAVEEKLSLKMTEYKNIDEIKNFVNQNKLTDVEDEDIQYALKYGTSLFADHRA